MTALHSLETDTQLNPTDCTFRWRQHLKTSKQTLCPRAGSVNQTSFIKHTGDLGPTADLDPTGDLEPTGDLDHSERGTRLR